MTESLDRRLAQPVIGPAPTREGSASDGYIIVGPNLTPRPNSPVRRIGEPIYLPTKGEEFFTFFVLLLSTGAFMNLLAGEGSNAQAGSESLFMQAVWSAIYLSTFLLLLRRCKGFISTLVRERLLLLLVALAVLSVFWSDDPALTFRRSVALIGATMFGVYLAWRFSLADQLKLLSRALVVAAILSLVFVVVLPPYGIAGEDFDHAWQGIYGHKNVLGTSMALGLVVFAFRATSARRESLRWWAAGGLALLLLLNSRSTTGVLACLFTVSAFVLSHSLRWKSRRVGPFFLALGVILLGAGIWAVDHAAYVFSLLGRSESLTGRTTIWLLSMVMITRRPWLGYGYSEFWSGFGSNLVSRMTGGFETSHAHNAILNLWLDIGLLGVVIFVLQYLRSVRWAIREVRFTKSVERLWPLVFLVFLGIYGLDESVILQRNSLSWMLYTAIVLHVSSRSITQLSRSRHSGDDRRAS
jgi:exopolysaccharide production protein ExoQ